jgi:methionyl-tRNA formyltransferase
MTLPKRPLVVAKQAIVFFGSEAWGVPTLEALVTAGLKPSAVITRPDAPAGRKRLLQPTPIKVAALAHGLKVWEPERIGDIIPQLEQLGPALGVLIAYGKIIPQSVLDVFPLGIVNFHPSPLPKYRGPSPIETAILEGADPGHISFIKLNAGMDAGDIVAHHQIKLDHAERLSALQLYHLLGEAGAQHLVESVKTVLACRAKLTPQDNSKATYSRMINKADGELDYTKTALQLEREIRAFRGWPGSYSDILNTKVILTASHLATTDTDKKTEQTAGTVLRTDSGELAVATSDGLLAIDRLIPVGKREMTGREFLAGHRLT